jgi:hypothetical protein
MPFLSHVKQSWSVDFALIQAIDLVRCRRSICSLGNTRHTVRISCGVILVLGCVCLLSRSWGIALVLLCPWHNTP